MMGDQAILSLKDSLKEPALYTKLQGSNHKIAIS